MRWQGQIEAGAVIGEIAARLICCRSLRIWRALMWKVANRWTGAVEAPVVGENIAWPDRIILSHQRAQLSARNQRFRLDVAGKLYDMVADGGQTTDVSQDHPDITRGIVRCSGEISRRGVARHRRPPLCRGPLEIHAIARARWGAFRFDNAQRPARPTARISRTGPKGEIG